MSKEENKRSIPSNDVLTNCGQFLLQGGSQALALFGSLGSIAVLGPVGAGITAVALSAWQAETLNRSIQRLEEEIAKLDRDKIDKAVFGTDEHKDFSLKWLEEASRGSSIRREVLIEAFVNSVKLPTSKMTGKISILRILSSLSDEEILVLQFMQNLWENNVPFVQDMELRQGLTEVGPEALKATCQGLEQLRLLDLKSSDIWGLSSLGRRMISLLSGVEEQEEFTRRQQLFELQFKEEIDSKIASKISQALADQSRRRIAAAGL